MILLELSDSVRWAVLREYLKLRTLQTATKRWDKLSKSPPFPSWAEPMQAWLSQGVTGWENWCEAHEPSAKRYLLWLKQSFDSEGMANRPEMWDILFGADYSTMTAIICWMKEYVVQHKISLDSGLLLEKLFCYDTFRGTKGAQRFFTEFYHDTLGLSICPYCNRNWITSIPVKEKHRTNNPILTAQFDHYFPKKLYPFLALSLFNLVPVCPTCNLRKLETDPLSECWNWYPYEAAHCGHVRFRLNLASYYDLSELAFAPLPIPSEISNPKPLVELCTEDTETDVGEATKSPHSVLLLDSLYQSHEADVQEMIFRVLEYNQSYFRLMIDSLPGPEDMRERFREKQKEYILQGSNWQRQIRHTPLGKLKRDISSQLLLKKQKKG